MLAHNLHNMYFSDKYCTKKIIKFVIIHKLIFYSNILAFSIVILIETLKKQCTNRVYYHASPPQVQKLY